MDQQRNAQCFDTFVKRPEKLAVEIFAVDVLVNDDGMKPQLLDRVLRFGDAKANVLQGCRRDADEPVGITFEWPRYGSVKRATDTGAHLLVNVIVKGSIVGDQHLPVEAVLRSEEHTSDSSHQI